MRKHANTVSGAFTDFLNINQSQITTKLIPQEIRDRILFAIEQS